MIGIHRKAIHSLLTLTLLLFLTAGVIPSSAGTVPGSGNKRNDVTTHQFHPAGMQARHAVPAAKNRPVTLSPNVRNQIRALLQEKATRTPAQRKISSHILYTSRMLQGKPAATGVATLDTGAALDEKNRLVVDISADVSEDLLSRLNSSGVKVLASYPKYHSIRAVIPADKVEPIAAWSEIRRIGPKREAKLAHAIQPKPRQLTPGFEKRATQVKSYLSSVLGKVALNGIGSMESEGDVTHQAYEARAIYGVSGSGVKIGVLSDGVTSLADSQALGDLGPVTVLPGQEGDGDEGTAMLEVIHDLAPGAELYFATAFESIEGFATNIEALRAAGCDIIVDDVSYYTESPFQNGQASNVDSFNNAGIVIQAVNNVTASGALYFSSAGNDNNIDSLGISGVYEGDFQDGGEVDGVLADEGVEGSVNKFGTALYATVTATGGPVVLQWSDPLGASANDYDLFDISDDGTIIYDASTEYQTGTEDPIEGIYAYVYEGERLVVVKAAGAEARYLRLDTFGGAIDVGTAGAIYGHNGAEATITMAATPAYLPWGTGYPTGPFPEAFNVDNVVEYYSSDGPRRIFFDADGTPITAGNFSSTGGRVLAKPDFTAADGISVTGVGDFGSPFYGTSAAGPHAAAITALVKSGKPSLTNAQIRQILTDNAIDIMEPGPDRDSGAGILMALASVRALGIPGVANPEFEIATATENPGNNDGIVRGGEGAKLVITINNKIAGATATGISGTLTPVTSGVTVTQPANSTFSDLAVGASTTNATPFYFTLPSDFDDCSGSVDFNLALTYTGGSAPTKTLKVSVPVGPNPIIIKSTLATEQHAPAGITTGTGTQNGRLTRDGKPSVCGKKKSFPGTYDEGTSHAFDSYSFDTCRTGCVSMEITNLNPNNYLQGTAYKPTFAPEDPSTNYFGDSGNSASGGKQAFAIDLAAGETVTAVVTDSYDNAVGQTYTLKIPGCATSCATSTNHVPVAKAKNVTVARTTTSGAPASIDDGSYDPDGAGDTLTLTQTPAGPYTMGTTSVMLTVTDTKGATAQATATVRVVEPVTIATATTDSATVTAGGSANYSFNVTTATGAITFSCSGLPTASACAFNGFAPTETSGQGSGQVSMTITTTAPTAAKAVAPQSKSSTPVFFAMLTLPMFGLFALGNRRNRKVMVSMVLALVVIAGLLALTGCGGSSKTPTPPPTPPPSTAAGTYTITVNATTATASASTHVTLIVH